MQYRKKPVVIDAVRVAMTDFNAALLPALTAFDGFPFEVAPGEKIPDWLAGPITDGTVFPHSRGSTDYAQWDITTLEGVMTAQPGDWIIRGIKGEIYPCKPDIFAATYDPA